jgi:DNA-directed RNA polymerase beta' subunit
MENENSGAGLPDSPRNLDLVRTIHANSDGGENDENISKEYHVLNESIRGDSSMPAASNELSAASGRIDSAMNQGNFEDETSSYQSEEMKAMIQKEYEADHVSKVLEEGVKDGTIQDEYQHKYMAELSKGLENGTIQDLALRDDMIYNTEAQRALYEKLLNTIPDNNAISELVKIHSLALKLHNNNDIEIAILKKSSETNKKDPKEIAQLANINIEAKLQGVNVTEEVRKNLLEKETRALTAEYEADFSQELLKGENSVHRYRDDQIQVMAMEKVLKKQGVSSEEIDAILKPVKERASNKRSSVSAFSRSDKDLQK